jgi:hypothetical protein
MASIESQAPVIVVSGLPRSGTSMTMQMLVAAGVPVVTDGKRGPGEDNPKGYYEDERVKRLHKEDGAWLSEARGKAVKIISFLLKDLPSTNRYKVIFLNRTLSEVLASQRKMMERRGQVDDTTDETMYELWTKHLSNVKQMLKSCDHFELLEVAYSDVVANPRAQAQRIREFVGLPLDVEKMAAAVDEALYRNRR